MKTNILPYSPNLKKLAFGDIVFAPFSTSGIKPVFYDGQLKPEPDTLGFRDMLLEVCSLEAGIEVLKLNLLMTPNQPDFDRLAFLYLEDKTILPVRLEAGENYNAWAKTITEHTMFGETTIQDWLLEYSEDECAMSGMSHEWEGKIYSVRDKELYTETGKFLFDNSPKKFNLKKIAAEKSSFLKKYINTSGQNLDTGETVRAFDRMVARSKAKANAPVENVETLFQSFRESAGYELPTELKAIYSVYNGTEEIPGKNYVFLGIDALLSEWKSWKVIFDDWLLDELKQHEADGQKSLPMYVTPYWIPFMSDGSGNCIAIDYAPGKKGQSGQVIVFGADEDKITVRAENLNVFLDLF